MVGGEVERAGGLQRGDGGGLVGRDHQVKAEALAPQLGVVPRHPPAPTRLARASSHNR